MRTTCPLDAMSAYATQKSFYACLHGLAALLANSSDSSLTIYIVGIWRMIRNMIALVFWWQNQKLIEYSGIKKNPTFKELIVLKSHWICSRAYLDNILVSCKCHLNCTNVLIRKCTSKEGCSRQIFRKRYESYQWQYSLWNLCCQNFKLEWFSLGVDCANKGGKLEFPYTGDIKSFI